MSMLTTVMPESANERVKRPLRAPEPTIHRFLTTDRMELQLTRFPGGSKGPIILAPGFGTSTLAYRIDTIETNITEYLCANGYDVWLFDYRASPYLAASHTQFTLDDIARIDYPAAVAEVRRLTGAETVQVLGHCVASGALLMSLLAGLEHVRSAICSQFLAMVIQPTINQVKARSHLAFVLKYLGDKWMTPEYHRSLEDRAFNQVLALYPSSENCGRPVCRRILFMYGEVFKHAQLNEQTHDAVPEMFGIGNMTGFEHLSRIIAARRLVDFGGNDVYLPNVGKLRTPICLLQGAENHIFLKQGGQQTYDWLCAHNDPSLFSYYLVPNYRHMDCFIGKNASWDIFPLLTAELDRYN